MKIIKDYLSSKKSLFELFQCEEDYYIKDMLDYKWNMEKIDGVSFLQYWKSNEDKKTSVIVNKNGESLTYKTEELTMVIAIDCIKIAFIFNNRDRSNF